VGQFRANVIISLLITPIYCDNSRYLLVIGGGKVPVCENNQAVWSLRITHFARIRGIRDIKYTIRKVQYKKIHTWLGFIRYKRKYNIP